MKSPKTIFRAMMSVVLAVSILSMIVTYSAATRQAFAQLLPPNCDPTGPFIHTLTVVVTPSTDTNVQFEQHTVTATLSGFFTDPDIVNGVTVNFEVTGANIAAGPGIPVPSSDQTQWTFTYVGINAGDDTITATATGSALQSDVQAFCLFAIYTGAGSAAKTWSMFVIPESPIGIIALMGSSLAALGGFMFWKRRSKNPTGALTGLSI